MWTSLVGRLRWFWAQRHDIQRYIRLRVVESSLGLYISTYRFNFLFGGVWADDGIEATAVKIEYGARKYTHVYNQIYD